MERSGGARRPWRPWVVALLWVASACGGSDGGDFADIGSSTTQAPLTSSTSQEPPAQTTLGSSPRGLEPGEVGVYLSVHTGSSEARVADITVRSSSGAVLLIVPAAGRAVEVTTFGSPEYAPNAIRPYTIDDRLFLLRKWSDSGTLDVTELDVGDGHLMTSMTTYDDVSQSTFSIIGDAAFYKTETEYVMGRGDIGGEFYTVALDGTQFGGEMVATAGTVPWSLYGDGHDIYVVSAHEEWMTVARIDPFTGEAGAAANVFAVPAGHPVGRVAIDGGTIFWTSIPPAGGELELWALAEDGPRMVTSFANPILTQVNSLDVDDGYFLVYGYEMPATINEDFLATYDAHTDVWDRLDFDVHRGE